jgi:molecular chaperone GrpE
MSRRIFVDKKMNKEDMEPLPPDGEPQGAGAESPETSGESTSESAAKPAEGAVAQANAISQEQFELLKAERDSLLDRLARLQAEFEKARKREARERSEFREFAVAGAVELFLPVLDNFHLALKATGSADQLRAGVELIVKQMEDALRTLNVQPVEAVGAAFDPRVHEAIEMVERPDVPDHQVFEEVRRGYRIKDRLLRPAMVRVASNPQQKEA